MKPPFTEQYVKIRLDFFPNWVFNNNGIERDIKCKDFVEAFGLMTQIAAEAERLNHHPEWSNVYNKIHIRLTTHDSGGVTDKDFELAEIINKLIK